MSCFKCGHAQSRELQNWKAERESLQQRVAKLEEEKAEVQKNGMLENVKMQRRITELEAMGHEQCLKEAQGQNAKLLKRIDELEAGSEWHGQEPEGQALLSDYAGSQDTSAQAGSQSMNRDVEIMHLELEKRIAALEANRKAAELVPRDLMVFLERFPAVGYLFLVNHIVFWLLVTLSPMAFDQTLQCKGRVPNATNAFFIGVCAISLLFELTVAYMTERGQALLRKRGHMVLLSFFSLSARFDAYGDSTFTAIAKDCNSAVAVFSLAVFVIGCLVLQALPGFYYLWRFLRYRESPYLALMYLEMPVLVEAIDAGNLEMDMTSTYQVLESSEDALDRTLLVSKVSEVSPQDGEMRQDGEMAVTVDVSGKGTDAFENTGEALVKMEPEDAGALAEDLKEQLLAAIAERNVELVLELNNRAQESLIVWDHATYTAAGDFIRAEYNSRLLVASSRRIVASVRFSAEDILQTASQLYFLYENWFYTSWSNRCFTIASATCSFVTSLSGPVLARYKYNQTTQLVVQDMMNRLQAMCTSMDIAMIELPKLLSNKGLPQKHPLRIALQQVQDELAQQPTSKAHIWKGAQFRRMCDFLGGHKTVGFDEFLQNLVVTEARRASSADFIQQLHEYVDLLSQVPGRGPMTETRQALAEEIAKQRRGQARLPHQVKPPDDPFGKEALQNCLRFAVYSNFPAKDSILGYAWVPSLGPFVGYSELEPSICRIWNNGVLIGTMSIAITWTPTTIKHVTIGQLLLQLKYVHISSPSLGKPERVNPWVKVHLSGYGAWREIERWDPRAFRGTIQQSFLQTSGDFGGTIKWEKTMTDSTFGKVGLFSRVISSQSMGFDASTGQWRWNDTWGKQYSTEAYQVDSKFFS